MKILAVTPMYPPHSRVGAWLATHEQLRHLAAADHQVQVWAFMANKDAWTVDAVEVLGRDADRARIAALAAEADVVVAHCGDNGRGARVAEAAGVPLAQLFHGGPLQPHGSAGLVVFNSEAARADTGWSGPSLICRPWTNPADHATEPGSAVTLVNCSRAKGVKVFRHLVARLPEREWLAVLGGYGNQRPPAGVETLPPTQSMQRDVWPRTRILLMPSIHEAWGMVGVEALASGIPVIASDLPGLRESLGDAGVFLPPNDIDAWAAEVERLHDPAEWAVASKAALARSDELAADDPRPRFAAALEALCSS